MKYCRAVLILAVLVIAYCVAVLTAKLPFAMAVLAAVVFFAATRKGYRKYSACGTAKWADAEDLEQAGMLSDRPGLILGRVIMPRPAFIKSLKALFDRNIPSSVACERLVLAMRKLQPRSNTKLARLSNAVHISVFAPTGVGKGVSCVIPHLLNSPDSMVVVDFKGENYQITAEHRRRAFGHKVVVLDPFRVVTQEPDTFNPLDQIDPSSSLVIDDCRALAEALVIRTGEEKDPHWADSAELWIGAMATTVALYGEDRFALQLMPHAADTDAIPTEGKGLVVVADVKGVLHFRIFDSAEGLMVKDTNETELPHQARRIIALKRLISSLPSASQPAWSDEAQIVTAVGSITGYAAAKGDRLLQTMRTLLTNPHKMAAVIKLMCESTSCDGMVARVGHQLTNYKDKELASVLTTTNRFMKFLDTLAISANTEASSFDPSALCAGKMTVYLVLPPEHMRAQAALLRMWIGAMLRAVVRGGLQESNKVHFVLDEAASLGRMDALDDAVDKYRGYGVRLLFFYQSIGQLKKCWGEGGDQTLLSNTTQIYFGVNDQQTAEYVSNRLGEATIIVDSGGTSEGGSDQFNSQEHNTSTGTNWNRNSNWGLQARKLLKPEEVVGLSPRTAITFAPGVPPIATTLTRYYEDPGPGKARWRRARWLAEVWLAAAGLLLLAIASAVAVTAMQVPVTR